MVLNEKEYIEEIIRTGVKPEKMFMKTLIRYIAKYYYEPCKDMKPMEYRNYVFDVIKSFDFDSSLFRESIFANFTRDLCSKLLKGEISHELADPHDIPITAKELEVVKTAPTLPLQKLLFTMYILARTRDFSNGWVNYTVGEIFRYAGLYNTQAKQLEMLHILIKQGLIEKAKDPMRISFKVTYYPESKNNPVVARINKFEKIGNQYVLMIDDTRIMCKECGRLIKKPKAPGRPMIYCKKCAAIVKSRQNLESYYRVKNATANKSTDENTTNTGVTQT